jgi:hypothetical protein
MIFTTKNFLKNLPVAAGEGKESKHSRGYLGTDKRDFPLIKETV